MSTFTFELDSATIEITAADFAEVEKQSYRFQLGWRELEGGLDKLPHSYQIVRCVDEEAE